MDAKELTENALAKKKRRTAAIGKGKAAQSHQKATLEEKEEVPGNKDTSYDDEELEG